MGTAFVFLLRKSSSSSLSANPAERVLCREHSSFPGPPEMSWGDETSDNHLVQCRYCSYNARKFRTWILRVMRLRAPMCGRDLSCDRLPKFIPFSSLQCCLCIPSLPSLLPVYLSLTCLSNNTTDEARVKQFSPAQFYILPALFKRCVQHSVDTHCQTYSLSFFYVEVDTKLRIHVGPLT